MPRHSPHPTSGFATLAALPAGTSARLVGVDGEGRDVKRLLELGVGVGRTLTVTRTHGANVVVACGAGRVAVGPELARRMHVETIS